MHPKVLMSRKVENQYYRELLETVHLSAGCRALLNPSWGFVGISGSRTLLYVPPWSAESRNLDQEMHAESQKCI